MSKTSRNIVIAVVFAAVFIVGIQVWGSIESSRHTSAILHQVQQLQQDQLAGEKAKQELAALQIENETKALLWTSLIASLGTGAAVVVALLGIWKGIQEYFTSKEKERIDRAVADLSKMWEALANSDVRVRAGAVVGLQHYLTPDNNEFHHRVLSALAVASRIEQEAEVLHIITIAVQGGLKQTKWELAHQISWQGAKLKRISLAGVNLSNFDFRDADLEDGDLRDCNLLGALFNAANLKGIRMDGANLTGANLEYADLAGASLVAADLTTCNIANAKILNTDVQGTDLSLALFDPQEVNWRLTKNWRQAKLDVALHSNLIKQFGPPVQGKKVLMMTWEFPPLAAGGAWTAGYHIMRNLRKQGANLVVMVPWKRAELNLGLFGNDVEFVTMEIKAPGGFSADGREAQSEYGRPYSVYGNPSVYDKPYAVYGKGGLYSGQFIKEGPIGGLVREFQYRALRYAKRSQTAFDVIYAPDWPTFWAAEEISKATNKPWIAHFHSTERDRRRKRLDEAIVAIERRGAKSANHIITPSKFTAHQVSELYEVSDSKISVMPNPLAEDEISVSETGSFDTKRVTFVGRLVWQKGPDLFVKICHALSSRFPSATFAMFGDGEEASEIDREAMKKGLIVQRSGFVEWDSRGAAFGNSSAIVVPSRAEPFGMVVLEAMERGVPVLYPHQSGAAEVLRSGIKINPDDIEGTTEKLYHLLADRDFWEKVAEDQITEIKSYYLKGYEQTLLKLFSEVPSFP